MEGSPNHFQPTFFIWHNFSRLEFSPLVFHSAPFFLLASVVSFIPSFFQALVSDAGMYIISVMLGTETVCSEILGDPVWCLCLYIYSTNCFIVADPDFVRFQCHQTKHISRTTNNDYCQLFFMCVQAIVGGITRLVSYCANLKRCLEDPGTIVVGSTM